MIELVFPNINLYSAISTLNFDDILLGVDANIVLSYFFLIIRLIFLTNEYVVTNLGTGREEINSCYIMHALWSIFNLEKYLQSFALNPNLFLRLILTFNTQETVNSKKVPYVSVSLSHHNNLAIEEKLPNKGVPKL